MSVPKAHIRDVCGSGGPEFFSYVEIAEDGFSGEFSLFDTSPADLGNSRFGDDFGVFSGGLGSDENSGEFKDAGIRAAFAKGGKFGRVDQRGNFDPTKVVDSVRGGSCIERADLSHAAIKKVTGKRSQGRIVVSRTSFVVSSRNCASEFWDECA